MRKSFLLIATIVTFAAGCKKETTEITASPSQQSIDQLAQTANLSVCMGNTWAYDQATPATEDDPTLVYNNKAYVFQSSDWYHISIFDGTTWTTIGMLSPLGEQHPDFCFAIGNKGYFGFSLNVTKGFWEYDFVTGAWSPKANFPGLPRFEPATFTIGNKGYLVAGAYITNTNYLNYGDTWEYDPANNVWTQKASFPLFVLGRFRATGFAIGNMGYIVNGQYAAGNNLNNPADQYLLKSLMQYDPAADAWTIKANFPGNGRYQSSCFVISGLAYVGGGMVNGFSSYNDFYKYYPASDTWLAIPDIPLTYHFRTISFVISSKGYIGYDNLNHPYDVKLVKYTPLTCSLPPPSYQ